jgi:hypothetical protein
MAGIIRRLSTKMKCRFFPGMPTAAFDSYLVFWAPNWSTFLRRRQGFPSYAWTGWIGQVAFQVLHDENEWLSRKTWIVWYKRSASGTVSLVWDTLANESFPITDMEVVGYRKRSSFAEQQHTLNFSTSRTSPTEQVHFEREFPQYQVLQFWTLAVYFALSNFSVSSAKGYIIDDNRIQCGSIYIDDYEDGTVLDTEGPLEFIVVSESEGRPDFLDLPDLNGFYSDSSEKYYHVLLLK